MGHVLIILEANWWIHGELFYIIFHILHMKFSIILKAFKKKGGWRSKMGSGLVSLYMQGSEELLATGWLASLERGSIKNTEYKRWARTCYTLEGQCPRGHCWDLPPWAPLTWILGVSLSHGALWGFYCPPFWLWLCNKQKMSCQLYFTNCRIEDTEECHPVS